MIKKRKMGLLVYFVLSLSFISFTAYGATILEKSLDEMLQEADVVFEGKVINAVARESTNGASIHTYVTFRILEMIKGNYPADTIRLRFLGGEAGKFRLKVSDMDIPAMGEKGIYFVESVGRNQINPLLGWSQGHLLVTPDENGTERVLSRDKRPIISFETRAAGKPLAVKSLRLSKGIAAGLVAGKRGVVSDGLSVTEFIRQLRKRLEAHR